MSRDGETEEAVPTIYFASPGLSFHVLPVVTLFPTQRDAPRRDLNQHLSHGNTSSALSEGVHLFAHTSSDARIEVLAPTRFPHIFRFFGPQSLREISMA